MNRKSWWLDNSRYPNDKLKKVELDIRDFLAKKSICKNKPEYVEHVLKVFLKDISTFHIERKGMIIKGFSPDLMWDIVSIGESLSEFVNSWFHHARDVVMEESDKERDNPIWYATYSTEVPTYFYDVKKEKWFLLDVKYDPTKKKFKQYQTKLLTLKDE